MATIDWPSTLRGAIQNTTTIQQAAGFLESNPAAGASYTQFFTDDQPVIMAFDLVFSKAENQYFESWARVNGIFKTGAFFNFPVTDEYGTSIQEVRFLAAGRPSWSPNGNVKRLSGCQILIPDYVRPDAETVLSAYDVYGIQQAMTELEYLDLTLNPTRKTKGEYLDVAINVEWPV